MTEDGRMRVDDERGLETREWIESLEEVLVRAGEARVSQLFAEISSFAKAKGVELPFTANTPYINSIPLNRQPPYPGNRELEDRVGSIIRWNAMAMVVRANRKEEGIGGHIASYASSATLYEVGFNHFFRGNGTDHKGDLIYSRAMSRPASMPARSSKGGCRSRRSTTSGTNCMRTGRGFPRIRTPG